MHSLASNTEVTFRNKGLLYLYDEMPSDTIRETSPEHVGFLFLCLPPHSPKIAAVAPVSTSTFMLGRIGKW